MSELPVPNPSDQPPTGVDPSVEPDAARWRRSIRVSGSGGGFVYRVGELIVKGTCQTCHEASPATGKRPTESAIPPLSGMTASHSAKQFVAGSRHRSQGAQGGLKGKGPEVTYLRDHELEAAYFYLTAYPPR